MSMTEYGIKELKNKVKENKVLTFEERKYINNALTEIQQYRAIGTVGDFKALKEKNTPMKPIVRGLGQRYCPTCKCGGADHFYCTRCGQKLG